MQISHRSNEDFANKYTNKLLFKASNIHLKPNETISPIRKKSMIDSNFASLQNYETDQWTDRYQRIREKNRSCIDFPEEPELSHQNSSSFLQLSQNLKQTMQNIEKKLKNFKFAKENDHNSCASTIAKMKCFCIDNCCFDFYRCTDLILLKYMIYLLIQELNQKKSENVQVNNEPQQQQTFKNLIKDAISIMHETVEEMKNKHDRNSNVDQLNKQIRKMQQAIGVPNFDVFTTPPSNLKKSDILLKPQSAQSATQKRDSNVSSPTINSQKIIQFQIDELQMKNEQIQKLLAKTKDLESQIKTLNQQLSETQLSLSISQKSLQNKEQELKDLFRKTDKLLETTTQAVKDKDQYQNHYKNIKQEHDQLKTLFDDLQRSNQSIIQEFHVLKQSQDDSMFKSKKQEDEEKIQLKSKLKEKQKLIKQIADEGQQLGTQLKEVSMKIMNIPPDQLPPQLQSVQRDFYLKETSINQKINNMHLAQLDRGKEQKLITNHMTNHMIDEVQLYRTHSDFMTMLLIQSEVIEKFIN